MKSVLFAVKGQPSANGDWPEEMTTAARQAMRGKERLAGPVGVEMLFRQTAAPLSPQSISLAANATLADLQGVVFAADAPVTDVRARWELALPSQAALQIFVWEGKDGREQRQR